MNSSQHKFYAGIGSRKTPQRVGEIIRELAIELDRQGYTLRSGGADGADTFFEESSTRMEIFLPWKGFNKRPTSWGPIDGAVYFQGPSRDAIELARCSIEGYEKRTMNPKMLLARNMHQILGEDLKAPVDFVICWTPGGKVMGGTGHAIKLARLRDIPVYNLARPSDVASIRQRVFQRELF